MKTQTVFGILCASALALSSAGCDTDGLTHGGYVLCSKFGPLAPEEITVNGYLDGEIPTCMKTESCRGDFKITLKSKKGASETHVIQIPPRSEWTFVRSMGGMWTLSGDKDRYKIYFAAWMRTLPKGTFATEGNPDLPGKYDPKLTEFEVSLQDSKSNAVVFSAKGTYDPHADVFFTANTLASRTGSGLACPATHTSFQVHFK